MQIEQAIRSRSGAVPWQTLVGEGCQFAVVQGYAFDRQQKPAFVILPAQGSFELLRMAGASEWAYVINHLYGRCQACSSLMHGE